MRHKRRVNPETHEELEHRIREQFPALYITLVSVLVGLALADLVAEARVRMVLWPLDLDTLRTWGELTANLFSALSAWTVYAHLGISRRRIPTFADSLIAFSLPLFILILNSYVGVSPMWKWLYLASGFLVFSLATTLWNFRILREETELASFHHLSRITGYPIVFITGIPFYAAAGWADQHGYLSPLMETIVAWIPAPSALFTSFMFLREWRAAIDATHHDNTKNRP
ncbi:MAG TPA: hypothetical protein VMF58_18215 [Rhizomicrobium sp.]|nr:hypothetical protein [Rhizomicrobium sp.]